MNCLKSDFTRVRFLVILFSVSTYFSGLLIKNNFLNYKLILNIHFLSMFSTFFFPIILVLTSNNKKSLKERVFNRLFMLFKPAICFTDMLLKLSRLLSLFWAMVLFFSGIFATLNSTLSEYLFPIHELSLCLFPIILIITFLAEKGISYIYPKFTATNTSIVSGDGISNNGLG